MKRRVTTDPYDEELWGEPQGPPCIILRCLTCQGTVTPGWAANHADICDNPVLQREMEEKIS